MNYRVQNSLTTSPYCGAYTPHSVSLGHRQPRFTERSALPEWLMCNNVYPQNTKEFLCVKQGHQRTLTQTQLHRLKKKKVPVNFPYRLHVFPGLRSVAIIFKEDYPAVIFFAKMFTQRAPLVTQRLNTILWDLQLDTTQACQWQLLSSKWKYQFTWPLAPRSIMVTTECWFQHIVGPPTCTPSQLLPAYAVNIMHHPKPHKRKRGTVNPKRKKKMKKRKFIGKRHKVYK
uniref:Uncharacterized protein n=1 Tax=viral metagenome TaxID=1070528 RepID=A0A6C0BMR2_9ZZZZ